MACIYLNHVSRNMFMRDYYEKHLPRVGDTINLVMSRSADGKAVKEKFVVTEIVHEEIPFYRRPSEEKFTVGIIVEKVHEARNEFSPFPSYPE